MRSGSCGPDTNTRGSRMATRTRLRVFLCRWQASEAPAGCIYPLLHLGFVRQRGRSYAGSHRACHRKTRLFRAQHQMQCELGKR